MSFILGAQRHEDCTAAFRRYRDYVHASRSTFPTGAYALASSEWYFDFTNHRCPHDAWIENVTISEPSTGTRNEERLTTIRLRLLAAYHDGFIELLYPRVFSYSLASASCTQGLGDWLYDEFRLSVSGQVVHEIEWAGFGRDPGSGSRWIIEASDVEYRWIPK